MTNDNVDRVQDAPQDVQVKSGEAEIANECQVRPTTLTDAEQSHEQKRRNYETNSSQCLPKVLVLDGEAGAKLVQIAEKVIDYVMGEEQTATRVRGDKVPLGEVQPAKADDPRRINPDDLKADDPRRINPEDLKADDPRRINPEDIKPEEPGVLDQLKSILDIVKPEFLTANLARGVVGDSNGDAGKKAKDANEPKADTSKPAEVDADKAIQRFKDANVPLSPEQEKQLRADLADIQKLPPETQKKIHESLDKIATADTKDGTKLTPAERAELVSSLAHQIAHPESIKQGKKETCVAANVEKTLATQHPDQYADMIAQLATKGEFTLPPGKDGKAPEPPTIKAQRDADGTLADPSDTSRQRSRTSDLAQGVIVNLGMGKNEGEYKSYPAGSADLRPAPAGVDPATDQGERVVTKVYGDEAKKLGVKDGEEVKKSFDGLSPDAKERVLDKLCPGDGYEGRLISNVDDLGKAWKDNGEKPPLNVGVRMDAPFLEKGSQAAGTHALTITHIEFDKDGKPSKIYYDNPAGGSDHSYPNGKPVPADEFVKGMQAKGRQPNSDGQVESWDQPLRATVRTDNQPDRQDKRLEKAAEEFHNAKNGDDMKKALEGKTRAEISEMNRLHQEKYGKSMATAVDENASLKINKDKKAEVQEALKGKDTSFANDPRHPMGLQNFTERELKKLQDDDGDVKGLDWRETKGTQKNADGSSTTNFEGEVETGIWDNGFKASETRDANGDLVGSKITYDSPIDQKFVSPQGEVEIKDIKTIETKRDANGNDVTTVTDKDGKVHTFVTDSKKNAVVGYKKPGE